MVAAGPGAARRGAPLADVGRGLGSVRGMVHDLAVLGATVAGLTAARRLASEGFDVVVLDPNPELDSAAIGHGVAAVAHSSTVAAMSGAYGPEAAREHIRRNLAGIEEIRGVLAAAALPHRVLPLHDHSLGVALDRELQPMLELMLSAGAEVRVLGRAERRRAGSGLGSEAVVLDPRGYAGALTSQARAGGARVLHDVTVVHLARRDGETLIGHRDNLAWSRGLDVTAARAVLDTIGVTPWGRLAGVGTPQYVPRVRFETPAPPDVVTLLSTPPVWLTRPDGGSTLAFGPKCAAQGLPPAADQLLRWVGAEGGTAPVTGRLTIDPSDHGRPVVGASAIPGGFYARGNGRGELMNGTASGCYLASLLLGIDRSAGGVALPFSSRLRAQARGLAQRLRRR